MEEIIKLVSEYMNINPFDKKKTRRNCECRYIIWEILRFKCSARYTTIEIGERFKLDHSTICQGIKKSNDLYSSNEEYRLKVDDVTRFIHFKSKMKSNFTFTLSVNHNKNIEDIIVEAKEIASRLMVNVQFNFKGIVVLVSPYCNTSEVLEEYKQNDERRNYMSKLATGEHFLLQ